MWMIVYTSYVGFQTKLIGGNFNTTCSKVLVFPSTAIVQDRAAAASSFLLSFSLCVASLCVCLFLFLCISNLVLHLWPVCCQPESDSMSSEISFTLPSALFFLPKSFPFSSWSSCRSFIATCVCCHASPRNTHLFLLCHAVCDTRAFSVPSHQPLYLISVSRPCRTPGCAKWTGEEKGRKHCQP